MRIGLLVLTVIAAAWAILVLRLSGSPPALMLVPLAVSLALLAFGWRTSGTAGSRGSHVGKVVGLWSAIEVAGILIAANVLEALHRSDLIFPVVAIVVGLHFFPLARGIPARLYHATGSAFVVAGLVGLVLPPAERPMVVGLSAAVILWTTALAIGLHARAMDANSAADSGA
jgi:hypothetical protein